MICVSEGIVDTDGQHPRRGDRQQGPGRQHPVHRGGRGGQAAPRRADRRRLLHPQAPQRERRRRHLRPQDRPHPARRPADPLRPLLRRAARRQGRRPARSRATTTAWRPCSTATAGSVLDSIDANKLRDRWGDDPRPAALADASTTRSGSSPRPRGSSTSGRIFTNALGVEDVEAIRSIFDTGNLDPPLRLGQRPHQQADPPARRRRLSRPAAGRCSPRTRQPIGTGDARARGRPPAPCLGAGLVYSSDRLARRHARRDRAADRAAPGPRSGLVHGPDDSPTRPRPDASCRGAPCHRGRTSVRPGA